MKHVMLVALLVGGSSLIAQSPDPSTLPLVQQADLVLAGKFHVPKDLEYGGEALAFNPAGPSLFIAKTGGIAELSIPAPSLTDPARAAYRQPLSNFIWDHMSEIGPLKGDRLGGLLIHDGRLIGSVYYSFDTDNSQQRSHFSHGLTLADAASFRGLSQVGATRQSGFTAGFMTPIPAEWQAKLGGNALTGQCCISIITRTSSGPAAFVMDAAKIGDAVVAAVPLLYYPADHATLGSWSDTNPNPVFGMSTFVSGVVIVPGTRSLLYFGANGMGKNCYGVGTPDQTLDGKPSPEGEKYCYDPMSNLKATHSYPYRYQVWAYDLNDLAKVKARQMRPWDVKPYGVWPLDLGPVQPPARLSATIDPASRRIYLGQYKGEPDGIGGGSPAIHALDVKVGR